MENQPIIVFDGVCNLCESSVLFVIRHDPRGKFKFASAQSAAGQQLQVQYSFDTLEQESVLLIKNERVYLASMQTYTAQFAKAIQ